LRKLRAIPFLREIQEKVGFVQVMFNELDNCDG